MHKLAEPKHSCAESMRLVHPPEQFGLHGQCVCGRIFQHRERTLRFVISRWLTLRARTYVDAQFGDVWVCVGHGRRDAEESDQ